MVQLTATEKQKCAQMAQVIRERGWTDGAWGVRNAHHSGPVCLLGAAAVVLGTPENNDGYKYFNRYPVLRKMAVHTNTHSAAALWTVNDGGTEASVLRLLDELANQDS